jgi:hypothetical protein
LMGGLVVMIDKKLSIGTYLSIYLSLIHNYIYLSNDNYLYNKIEDTYVFLLLYIFIYLSFYLFIGIIRTMIPLCSCCLHVQGVLESISLLPILLLYLIGIYVSIYLTVYLPNSLTICLSIYLNFYLSTYLPTSDWNPQNDVQAMARCHRYISIYLSI